MDGHQFRQLALTLPDAVEAVHRGHPDFRVRRKIFATLNADVTAGHVKCDPLNLEQRVRAKPCVFRDAWSGRWLGFDLSQIEEIEVLELLEDAWLSVTPRSLAESYERRGNECSQSSS